MDTLNSLLEERRQIKEAIAATRAGSSYSIGGRSLTRQDVESLRAELTRVNRAITEMTHRENGATLNGWSVATWHR